jgi:hypothetical protein
MNTEQIEAGLRDALARRAAQVPAHASDRLKQVDYRPRTGGPRSAVALGLGAAALALGSAAAYFAVGPDRPADTTQISLAAFQLPPGFTPTRGECAPLPQGVGGWMSEPGPTGFAAGASAHGGCVEAFLLSQALQPPATAAPTQVGPYQGFIASAASRTITLYVKVPGARSKELVIGARNLSADQVITIARRVLRTP